MSDAHCRKAITFSLKTITTVSFLHGFLYAAVRGQTAASCTAPRAAEAPWSRKPAERSGWVLEFCYLVIGADSLGCKRPQHPPTLPKMPKHRAWAIH